MGICNKVESEQRMKKYLMGSPRNRVIGYLAMCSWWNWFFSLLLDAKAVQTRRALLDAGFAEEEVRDAMQGRGYAGSNQLKKG